MASQSGGRGSLTRSRGSARSVGRALAPALVGALALAAGARAEAQTLRDYLDRGSERALEVREARQRGAEAAAQRTAAARTLFPSLRARGTFRRNQREESAVIPLGPEGELEEVVFTPRDEISAEAALRVPIVDVGAWQDRRAAGARADAARLRTRTAENDVARRIAEAYYQYVGASALVSSSEGALEAARAHAEVVDEELEAGLVTELDARRAEAQIARSEQTLAEAEEAKTAAARGLRVLTGVRPARDPPELEADLSAEAPLESWLEGVSGLSRVRAARAEARAGAAAARAAELFFVPDVSAFAEERYTNAAPFTEAVGWSVGVTAEWRFDSASFALADAERARARAASLRSDRVLRDARAEVEAAWARVRALRERAEAASAEAIATSRAAEIAREDYPARASQLDVVMAERDALAAEVERIRAAADLAYARAALRIAAGRGDEIGDD